MSTPKEMLEARVTFASHRIELVKGHSVDNMPKPVTKNTTSPTTLKAGKEVYDEHKSLIVDMMINELNKSKNVDAKAIKRLIKKYSNKEKTQTTEQVAEL